MKKNTDRSLSPTLTRSVSKIRDDSLNKTIEGLKFELDKLNIFESEMQHVFQLEEGERIIKQYKDDLKRAINRYFKEFREKFQQQVSEYTDSLALNVEELQRRLELSISNLEKLKYQQQGGLNESRSEASRPYPVRLSDSELDYEVKGYNGLVTEIISTKLEILVDKSPFEDIIERLSRYMKLSYSSGKESLTQPRGVLERLFENGDVSKLPTMSQSIKLNDSQILSRQTPVIDYEVTVPNFFDENSYTKALHFFEGDTKNLYLLEIDPLEKSRKNSVNFKKIVLNINFKIPLRHRSIITPQGRIFLTGGIDQNRPTNVTLKYNEDGNKIDLKSYMVYSRKSHGMCTINGFIYCIGGFTEVEGFTNCCERYDILADEWQQINSMVHKASSPSVCTFGKYTIYRFGGLSESARVTETIEKYDIRDDKWTAYDIPSAQLGFELLWLSASCQINRSQILVCGGCNEKDNPLAQTFLFEVADASEKGDTKFRIKKIKDDGLPKVGGFWNGQAITYNQKVYMLQNYTNPTNKTLADENKRNILRFGGESWELLA